MKIGVISDIHGSVRDLQHALEAIREEEVSLIMCVGDVLYHGPRNPVPVTYSTVETANIINNFPIPFVFARGNCDSEADQLLIKYPILNEFLFVYADGVYIAMIHGHKVKDFNREGENLKANLIISGHTHVPVIEKFSWGSHLNPGSITFPSSNSKKSFSIINIEKGKFDIALKEVQ